LRNDVVVEAYVRASDGFLAPLRGAVVIMPRFPGVALVSLAYPWLFFQHASGVRDSWLFSLHASGVKEILVIIG